MIVTGDLGDMLDVIGDLRDGRDSGAGCASSQACELGFAIRSGWPM